MFKVNNINTRTRCETCSKLTMTALAYYLISCLFNRVEIKPYQNFVIVDINLANSVH